MVVKNSSVEEAPTYAPWKPLAFDQGDSPRVAPVFSNRSQPPTITAALERSIADGYAKGEADGLAQGRQQAEGEQAETAARLVALVAAMEQCLSDLGSTTSAHRRAGRYGGGHRRRAL